MSEPNPKDLITIAIELAKIGKPKAPAEQLEPAWDLWQRAEQVLQAKREQIAKEQAETAKQQAKTEEQERKKFAEDAGDRMWQRGISFERIISEKRLPKSCGEKGTSSHITTEKGLQKALGAFFRDMLPLLPETELIPPENQKEVLENREKHSRLFLKFILQKKEIPANTFEHFLRWQQKRIGKSKHV